MPTEQENVQYLYLVLTEGGTANMNWDKISEELNLKKGATTKRWSRLKLAMDKGTDPGPSAQQFLWLCVKHSSRDKAIDWKLIAEKCNTTAGAASKRYSRMKLAFEAGTAAMPGTPPKGAAKTKGPDLDASPMKRKRTPGKLKKELVDDEEDYDIPDIDVTPKPKRARTTKPKGPKGVTTTAMAAAPIQGPQENALFDSKADTLLGLHEELADVVQKAGAPVDDDATFFDALEEPYMGTGADADVFATSTERVADWLEDLY